MKASSNRPSQRSGGGNARFQRQGRVTGAAQGRFGRVLAQAFVARGAKPALCDINDEGGAATLDLVKAEGADGFYSHADISQEANVESRRRRFSASAGSTSPSTTTKEITGPTLDLPSEISPRWSTPISRVPITA
ncbi:MAG: SDR family NAD(P)-dependent oxidoreductase [Hyphomicrobiales bacterium]